jgi:hypothetical protein
VYWLVRKALEDTHVSRRPRLPAGIEPDKTIRARWRGDLEGFLTAPTDDTRL